MAETVQQRVAEVLGAHHVFLVYEDDSGEQGYAACSCGGREFGTLYAAILHQAQVLADAGLLAVEASVSRIRYGARPTVAETWGDHIGRTNECPAGPHRGPSGPNEDLSQCPRCFCPTWSLRPEGETFGVHLADCSLPIRHEGYCVGGGAGHPDAAVIRG